MTAPSGPAAGVVPEIGPSLGRLVDPPSGEPSGRLGVMLDDLRLELVTRVFESAAASRRFAAAENREQALRALGRTTWLEAWERAVAAAAQRLTDAVNAELGRAAAESRFPEKRLERLGLTPEDTHVIAARLGGGSADFIAALDTLDTAAAAAARHDADTWRAWQEALGASARRIESAWLALERESVEEQARWHADIARVRSWRRPAWPLWLVAAAALAAATYVGLVLGGYVPVSAPLRGLAEFWWSR